MKKLIRLYNQEKDDLVVIEYQPNKKFRVGIIGLIIDIFALLLFDWWIWLPTIIITTIFSIKVTKKACLLVDDVSVLLDIGYQPKKIEDALALYKDFNFPIEAIEDFEYREQILSMVTDEVVNRIKQNSIK